MTATTNTVKQLLLIRHGHSLGNALFEKPGNTWGSPSFRDDPDIIDSPVSNQGQEQIRELRQRLEASSSMRAFLESADLVVVSPLTRTLQTMEGSVGALLPDHVPILSHPLCRERVYTASDTGRPVEELQREYPLVDFSLLLDSSGNDKNTSNDTTVWWYDGKELDGSTGSYKEWRPHGEGQWYAVPGEPKDIFEDRMDAFTEWLAERPEQKIVLVVHWAVLRHLTGDEFENCESRLVDWTPETA